MWSGLRSYCKYQPARASYFCFCDSLGVGAGQPLPSLHSSHCCSPRKALPWTFFIGLSQGPILRFARGTSFLPPSWTWMRDWLFPKKGVQTHLFSTRWDTVLGFHIFFGLQQSPKDWEIRSNIQVHSLYPGHCLKGFIPYHPSCSLYTVGLIPVPTL
jgi:hypothetical protein